MKAKLILIFCALLSWSVYAEIKEALPINTFKIIADKKSDTIPENMAWVTGWVKEAYTNNPVVNGLVSSLDGKFKTRTDEKGKYRLRLTGEESTIFFYHSSYGEILCLHHIKPGHLVVIEFVTGYARETPVMVEKPVVYLYSEESLTATVQLACADHLSFTYPQYNNGWEVGVKPNGTLDVAGQTYPYLFWEANQPGLNFEEKKGQMDGVFISTDSVVTFLEHSLTGLGLNATEKTDFITYWAPRMQVHDYAVVQWLVDDAYDRISAIDVRPKPDAMRRVFMLFQGTDLSVAPANLIEQELPSFNRKGFTLVEWGGAELSPRSEIYGEVR